MRFQDVHSALLVATFNESGSEQRLNERCLLVTQLQRTLSFANGFARRALPQIGGGECCMRPPPSRLSLDCSLCEYKRLDGLIFTQQPVTEGEQGARMLGIKVYCLEPVDFCLIPIIRLGGIDAQKIINIGIVRSDAINSFKMLSGFGRCVDPQSFHRFPQFFLRFAGKNRLLAGDDRIIGEEI